MDTVIGLGEECEPATEGNAVSWPSILRSLDSNYKLVAGRLQLLVKMSLVLTLCV